MEVQINTLTPELFLELYTSVGWEPPCIAQVKKALENTIATFTAYDNGRAVGMVRLIGDGGMSFYIKDFAVMPSLFLASLFSFLHKYLAVLLSSLVMLYLNNNA